MKAIIMHKILNFIEKIFLLLQQEWVVSFNKYFVNSQMGWGFLVLLLISILYLKFSKKIKNRNKYLFFILFAFACFGYILYSALIIFIAFQKTFIFVFCIFILSLILIYGFNGLADSYLNDRLPKPWWTKERNIEKIEKIYFEINRFFGK